MSYKNILWLAGPPVLVIALWIFAVYMPLEAQATKGRNAVNAVKQELKNVETSVLNMTMQIQTQEQLKKSYDDFLGKAPTIDGMSQFMTGVVRDARTKGMGVERLSGHYDKMDLSGKNVVNPVFEMGLRGDFLDMGKFLEELSGKTAFKGIQKASISYDEKDYPLLSGRFVIEFKALKGRSLESK